MLSFAAAILATVLLLLPAAAVTPLRELPPPSCPVTEPFLLAPLPPVAQSSSVPAADPDLVGLAVAAQRDLVAARRAVAALACGAADAARSRAAGATVAAVSSARVAMQRAATRGRKAAAAAHESAESRRADMAKRAAQARRKGWTWVGMARKRAAWSCKWAGIVAAGAKATAGRHWSSVAVMGGRLWVGGGALAVRCREMMVGHCDVVAGWVHGAVTVAVQRAHDVMQRGVVIARVSVRKAAANAPRLQAVMRDSLPLLGKTAFAFACICAGCALLVALLGALLEEKFAQPVGMALYAMMRAQLASLRKEIFADHQIGTKGMSIRELRETAALLLAEAEACAAETGGGGNNEGGVEPNVRLDASTLPKVPLPGRAALGPSLRWRKPKTALAEVSDSIATPCNNEQRRPLHRRVPSVTRRKQPIRVRYSDSVSVSVRSSLGASDTHDIKSAIGGKPVRERSNLYATEQGRQTAHETRTQEKEVIVIDD